MVTRRPHTLPRRWYRGADLFTQTPRQRYLYEHSKARYDRRPDAMPDGGLIKGEVGTYQGIVWIGCDFGREEPEVILALARQKRVLLGFAAWKDATLVQAFASMAPKPLIARQPQRGAQWKRETQGRRRF